MNRLENMPAARTMNIELRRVTFNERMSEETNCFAADLWINGAKVGTCQNRGQGGPTDYWIENATTREAFEAYAKSLPARVSEEFKNPDGTPFSYPMDGEALIDDLFSEWLKEREAKRIQNFFLKQKSANFGKGFPFTAKCRIGRHWLTAGLKTKEELSNWIARAEAKYKGKAEEAGLV